MATSNSVFISLSPTATLALRGSQFSLTRRAAPVPSLGMNITSSTDAVK
jgi:hypothetical protein